MAEYALDVAVPTHNHQKLTMQCLDALYMWTRVPFHLVIVDDSTDRTPQYIEDLKKEKDNITFVHSDEPYKCGNQFFNIGVANSVTPYVAFVMNSVEVEPDWDISGLQVMEADPKIGAIGFKCLFRDNDLIESAGIALNKFLPCDIGRDNPAHRFSKIYECDAVQWAFVLVRKAALAVPLDENIYHGFVGWDDIDDSFVLRSRGWKIVYCGLGAGFHQPRATRGNNTPEAFEKNRENSEIFYKRWGKWDEFKEVYPDAPETTKVEKVADYLEITGRKK